MFKFLIVLFTFLNLLLADKKVFFKLYFNNCRKSEIFKKIKDTA